MNVKFVTVAAMMSLLAACGSTTGEGDLSGSAAGGNTAGGDGGISSGSATDLTSSDLAAGPAPGTQEDFEVNVGDRVLFDLDQLHDQ